MGPIISASQRHVAEQNHGDINRQYIELKNSLNNCLWGAGAVESEGVGYRYLGSLGWVCECDKINVCLLNKDPAKAVFCYGAR